MGSLDRAQKMMVGLLIYFVLFNCVSASVDYSCIHSDNWRVNSNSHYNSYFSSYTDITTSAYADIARRKLSSEHEEPNNDGTLGEPSPLSTTGTVTGQAWSLTFTGIPNYDLDISASTITTLNSRPKASTDFKTGATTATAGSLIKYGASIGYTTKQCSLGYWPPGPSCPAKYSGSQSFTLSPAPETTSGTMNTYFSRAI